MRAEKQSGSGVRYPSLPLCFSALVSYICYNLLLMEKMIHHGRNVKRFREMLGIKQEALAVEMGDDWTQRRISLLEAKEEIDAEVLDKVAKVLKVPAEAIKNFDEEAAINNIACNFNDHASVNYKPVFNFVEKWL